MERINFGNVNGFGLLIKVWVCMVALLVVVGFGGYAVINAFGLFDAGPIEMIHNIYYKDAVYARDLRSFSGVHEEGYPLIHREGTITVLKRASKTGYSFEGWGLNSDGTNVVTQLDDNNFEGIEDIILYANWTKLARYTITFDKQGGTGGTDSVEVSFGEILPMASQPEKSGYSFMGYFDQVQGGQQYYSAAMVALKTYDRQTDSTLYAHWEVVTQPVEQYTVTLDKRGGSGGEDQVQVEYGADMPSATAPTRESYIFTGYYDNANGGNIYYNADMSSASPYDKRADSTLYAHWEVVTQPVEQYRVTFDKQGGTGGSSQAIAEYGKPMPTATAPTREDYTFSGYYDSASGGKKYYAADMSSAIDYDKKADIILYARWEADKYTVTFDKQGGVGGDDQVLVEYEANMPTAIAPARQGYNFTGYYDSASDGKVYYNADMSSASPYDKRADSTLYAQWEVMTQPTEQYTVTFDKQGGTGGNDQVIVEYGEPMPSAVPPTRQDRIFIGYYDSASGTTAYYNADMSSARAYDRHIDSTLYAHWQVQQYIVTFDKQGGSGGDEQVLVEYGANMPTAIAPTKEGYTFSGYYDSASGGTIYYNADMSSARVYDRHTDSTLYAQWQAVTPPVETYNVTLDPMGGTGGDNLVVVEDGADMPQATAPTRTNFSFNGYFDGVDGGTAYYNADMSSARKYDKGADTTLYARWIGEASTLTIDLNGGMWTDNTAEAKSFSISYLSDLPDIQGTIADRTGYIFDGIFSADDKQYYDHNQQALRQWDKSGDETLTAKWHPIEYSVIYDGSWADSGEMADSVFYYDTPATLSKNIYTKKGYYFNGWMIEGESHVRYTDEQKIFNLTTVDKDTIKLFANWTNQSYTVTLDPNGGDGQPVQITVYYMMPMPTDGIEIPTRAGYVFKGYYLKNDPVDIPYYNAQMQWLKYWDLTTDATLFAKWEVETT